MRTELLVNYCNPFFSTAFLYVDAVVVVKYGTTHQRSSSV